MNNYPTKTLDPTQTLHSIIVLLNSHSVYVIVSFDNKFTLLRCLMIPLDKLPSTFIITSITCCKQLSVRWWDYYIHKQLLPCKSDKHSSPKLSKPMGTL